MTTTFTRTRAQLADMVLRKLRALGAGATAISADADVVYEAIDLRLKEMHRLGTFWRKVTSVPVTFSISSSVATASAGGGDIIFPLTMTYSNGVNDDPVSIIGSREYAQIVDKTRVGDPERALWKGGSEVLVYPVPSANRTCQTLYEKIADDTTAGSAVDIDVSMIRWMKDIVAYDVSDDFGVPAATGQRWLMECVIAERNIKKLGQPHVDYEAVRVDDFDSYPYDDRRDYGR